MDQLLDQLLTAELLDTNLLWINFESGVLKTSEKLDTMGVFGKTVKDVALLLKL